MEIINTEELKDKLEYLKNKEVELLLDGIITTKLKIQLLKVKLTKDNIEIYTNKIEKIEFNIHQIMKTELENNHKLKIQFDNLQTATFLF